MKASKILTYLVECLALVGLAAGLIFVMQRAKPNGQMDRGQSIAAYPPPEATLQNTPAPVNTPSPVPSPTHTPTPIVLDNGWYLYTDPDGEFSFSYPPNGFINAGQNPADQTKNVIVQFSVPDKPYQGMSIRLERNPERLNVVDIAIQLYEQSAQKPVSAGFTDLIQQITVGNLLAGQVFIPSSNTETTIIIPFNDKYLIVAPLHDVATTKVEPAILETFFNVLDTIKIGDQM